jgi:putative transposase
MKFSTRYTAASVPGWVALGRWSLVSAQISPEAKKRLAWFDYYRTTQNVAKTCRHFGISRKAFYAWQKRYDAHALISLESKPSTPIRKRQRMITALQEERIITLRRRHLRHGKEKIARLYSTLYHEHIRSPAF